MRLDCLQLLEAPLELVDRLSGQLPDIATIGARLPLALSARTAMDGRTDEASKYGTRRSSARSYLLESGAVSVALLSPERSATAAGMADERA